SNPKVRPLNCPDIGHQRGALMHFVSSRPLIGGRGSVRFAVKRNHVSLERRTPLQSKDSSLNPSCKKCEQNRREHAEIPSHHNCDHPVVRGGGLSDRGDAKRLRPHQHRRPPHQRRPEPAVWPQARRNQGRRRGWRGGRRFWWGARSSQASSPPVANSFALKLTQEMPRQVSRHFLPCARNYDCSVS